MERVGHVVSLFHYFFELVELLVKVLASGSEVEDIVECELLFMLPGGAFVGDDFFEFTHALGKLLITVGELSIALGLLYEHFEELTDDLARLHEGLFHFHVESVLRQRFHHLPVLSFYAFEDLDSVVTHFRELAEDDTFAERAGAEVFALARNGRRESGRLARLLRLHYLYLLQIASATHPIHPLALEAWRRLHLLIWDYVLPQARRPRLAACWR